ncbi:MAG TPA: peptide-methionine (S)-S-oxide reductase MsrA [Candidatus Limnocylindria bacterium]|nr:peptide-methionine (S)-S-oxide reductase MsrA [Candidatus Limnocylindria bacterium]
MKTEKALFAAGCFWGVQYYFDQVPGVTKTTAGYTGGHTKNPTYDDVCYKDTGHAEATLIEFDPGSVSYETLVRQFFYMHDPTQMNQQGPDVGEQYRSAIFYLNESQRVMAENVRNELQKGSDKAIVTEVTEASEFYQAEDIHQKYTEKTGRGMCHVPYKEL